MRRHPSRALIALLMAAVAGSALYLVAARSGRRQEILESNLYTARQVGRELLERLHHWGERVAAAAASEELADRMVAWQGATDEAPPSGHRAFLAVPEQRALQAFCERLASVRDPALENWYLLDASGAIVARTPAHTVIGESFVDRDYFVGTRAHPGRQGIASVHVSRVYRSRADGLYKFNVSAPVTDARGRGLGVLSVSVTTGPDMGLVHLHDQRRKAMLLAPLDAPPGPSGAAAADGAGVGRFIILLHPAYAPRAPAIEIDRSIARLSFPRGCEGELSAATLDRAVSRRLDYRGGPAFAGRWLAGLAPVGNTGFVVVIQQPDL